MLSSDASRVHCSWRALARQIVCRCSFVPLPAFRQNASLQKHRGLANYRGPFLPPSVRLLAHPDDSVWQPEETSVLSHDNFDIDVRHCLGPLPVKSARVQIILFFCSCCTGITQSRGDLSFVALLNKQLLHRALWTSCLRRWACKGEHMCYGRRAAQTLCSSSRSPTRWLPVTSSSRWVFGETGICWKLSIVARLQGGWLVVDP